MDHESYVGIVHNLPHDSLVTLLVLHPGNKTLSHGSWDIQTASFNPFEAVNGGLSLKKTIPAYPEAFVAITNLLKARCGASTRMLIDFPVGEISASSAFSQLMACLIREGFGSCVIDFDDHSDTVHFREIPETQKPATVTDDLVFLANEKPRAYAMFLSGQDSCSDKQIALAASLIARNHHLHRYLKSRGLVFSSQDIAQYLRDPEKNNPMVLSGNVIYYLSRPSGSISPDIEDMHLEYALAAKRFSFLPKGEALKFALLCVCRQTGFRLHCLSSEDPRADQLLDEETLGPDEYVAFDPAQEIPDWLAQHLKV